MLVRTAFSSALLLTTSPALACAVCGGASRNQQAFLDTMVFMSAMPLLMIGGFAGLVWFISRKAAEAAEKDEARRLETAE